MNDKMHYLNKYCFATFYYFYSYFYYYLCLRKPAESLIGIIIQVVFLCICWTAMFCLFYGYFYRDYRNTRRALIKLSRNMIIYETHTGAYYKVLLVYECYKGFRHHKFGTAYRYLVKAKILRHPIMPLEIGKITTTNFYDYEIQKVSKLEEEMYK